MPPERTRMEKELSVRTVKALRAEHGHTLRAACAIAGESPANILRWEKEVEGEARERKAGGRPATWTITPEDRHRLRWLVASSDGSLPLALTRFTVWAGARFCPIPVPDWCVRRCPALGTPPPDTLAKPLAALMAKGGRWDAKLPKSLRNACALTKLEIAEILGDRARNDAGFKRQRVMEVRERDPLTGEARSIPLLAGMMVSSDDMSLNEPWRGEPGADGSLPVNRQTLATIDVYSRKWLGVHGIGRRGDAYTAVDIADHFGSIVQAVGLPFYWQLERGPWENDFLNGCAVPPAWCEQPDARWGGLENCFVSGPLLRICRKFNPQGKVIEGAFDYLQSLMTGHATSVGRRRGAHEHVSKMVQRAKEGNTEAARYLWGQGEAIESVWKRMMEDNARAKRRAFLGDQPAVPDELWRETFQRRHLPASDAWRMLPVKVCRVTRAQSLFVKLQGYGPLPYQFRVVGTDLPWRALDNGHRVAVAMHPDRPELGAVIASMETRGAYNREGFKLGEMLGTAPYVPPVPMEDFTGEADFSHQRNARAAVRQEIRAGGFDSAGLVRISRAADSLGHALKVSNQPEPESAPAPRGTRAAKETRSLAEIATRHAAEPVEEREAAPLSAWADIS